MEEKKAGPMQRDGKGGGRVRVGGRCSKTIRGGREDDELAQASQFLTLSSKPSSDFF